MSASERERRADAQQQAGDAPAQPERLSDAARQLLLAAARRTPGRPSGTISGPSAGGASSRSGKSSEPASRISCEPSMSTTYSATATPAARRASATSWSAIRCGGTSSRTCVTSSASGRSRPSRPGERNGSVATRPVGGDGGGTRAVELAVLRALLERLAGGEVAVQRRAADVGRRGDLGHRHVPVPGECAGSGEDALPAGERVGAKRSWSASRGRRPVFGGFCHVPLVPPQAPGGANPRVSCPGTSPVCLKFFGRVGFRPSRAGSYGRILSHLNGTNQMGRHRVLPRRTKSETTYLSATGPRRWRVPAAACWMTERSTPPSGGLLRDPDERRMSEPGVSAPARR